MGTSAWKGSAWIVLLSLLGCQHKYHLRAAAMYNPVVVEFPKSVMLSSSFDPCGTYQLSVSRDLTYHFPTLPKH